MDLRQARLRMIKAFAGGWDAMAAALGMSRDALENRIYERKGQSVLTEIDLQMQSFSGTTHFAEAVATLSGGTFVKLPSLDEIDNDSLLAKFNELHAEIGALSLQFNQFTKDNELDENEQRKMAETRDSIHRKTQELLGLIFRLYTKDGGDR